MPLAPVVRQVRAVPLVAAQRARRVIRVRAVRRVSAVPLVLVVPLVLEVQWVPPVLEDPQV